MQYTNLGRSGLKVSRIILGRMSLGEQAPEKGLFSSSWVMNEEESLKMLHQAFFELGINTFDTSNNYTAGQSERVIGKFLKKYNVPREQVVIMTKAYFHPDGVTEGKTTSMLKANGRGLSRKSLFANVDGSLERLGVSYIDVLQIHRFDPNTPIEETMHYQKRGPEPRRDLQSHERSQLRSQRENFTLRGVSIAEMDIVGYKST